MYEKFDSEERALFRDMEAFNLVVEVWCAFGEYLLAINKQYNTYKRIKLSNRLYIKRRNWARSHYMGTHIARTGMVIYRNGIFGYFGRKMLCVDYLSHKGYVPNNLKVQPVTKWLGSIGIFGIDLKRIDRLNSVILLLRLAKEDTVAKEEARIRRLKERMSIRNPNV